MNDSWWSTTMFLRMLHPFLDKVHIVTIVLSCRLPGILPICAAFNTPTRKNIFSICHSGFGTNNVTFITDFTNIHRFCPRVNI